MTEETTLNGSTYSNTDRKISWKESLKNSFLISGVLYAALQDTMIGNGRAAAEMMKTYRQMTA